MTCWAAIATSRTASLLAAHVARPEALTSGYQRGLFAGSLFMVAAAVIALRTSNTKVVAPSVTVPAEAAPEPAPFRSAGS